LFAEKIDLRHLNERMCVLVLPWHICQTETTPFAYNLIKTILLIKLPIISESASYVESWLLFALYTLHLRIMNQEELKTLLDQAVDLYQRPEFIADDPIQIPHRYTSLQNIEIAGFVAASFAWGQRKTIIAKASDFMQRMGPDPIDFILNHRESDLAAFLDFKHRTFNSTDALFFIDLLKRIYLEHVSMEAVFFPPGKTRTVRDGLSHFHRVAFAPDYAPERTKKHLATPERHSTCKRLNMFLRWMVRSGESGIDFGLWKCLEPAQLMIPLDVHVENVARSMGLLRRKQRDWMAVEELTDRLRAFDPADPVKYDFALFGMGVLAHSDWNQERSNRIS
jgi:uncharacterized protein (TIGR02757 family)